MFNLKTSQNKQILEEKYLVPQEFSLELEQLLKTINNRGLTKFILNKIRQTPIQNRNQLEEIKRIIQEQNKSTKDPIDEKINNITQNIDYKNWIKNLIKIGKIKEEDFLKIKSLLETFNKLSLNKTIPENKRNINLFKDDSELTQYLNQFAQKTETKLEDIKSGYTLIDKNDRVTLLKVTEEDTLKQICNTGETINWCVIHGSWNDYSPPVYYLFLIYNSPEVLIHKESNQIKDTNDDPLSNGIFINLINPFVEKYNLNTREGDFEEYDEKVKIIKKIQENPNDEKLINEELEKDPLNITLLDKQYWTKYINVMLERIREEDLTNVYSRSKYMIQDMPFDLLDFVAKYCKIHNLNDEFQKIQINIAEKLQRSDNFTRYHKIVPEILRTEYMSNTYKKKLQEIDKKIKETGQCPTEAINYCTNKLIKQEPKAWVESILHFIQGIHQPPYYAEEWVTEKLNDEKLINSEIQNKLIQTILYFISTTGKEPEFAYQWIHNNFVQQSNPVYAKYDEQLIRAVTQAIEVKTKIEDGTQTSYLIEIALRRHNKPQYVIDLENLILEKTKDFKTSYINDRINLWLADKLNFSIEKPNSTLSNLEKQLLQSVYDMVEKEDKCQLFAYYFCNNLLIDGKAPKTWYAKIDRYIEQNYEAPNYAMFYCKELLNKNKAPESWQKVITEHLISNNNPPIFAKEYVLAKMKQREIPQEWLNIIVATIKNDNPVPNFAEEWVEHEMATGYPNTQLLNIINEKITQYKNNFANADNTYNVIYKRLLDLIRLMNEVKTRNEERIKEKEAQELQQKQLQAQKDNIVKKYQEAKSINWYKFYKTNN